jgi:hypothetical protein
MGQLLYNGKWAIDPDTELDYIIDYRMMEVEGRQLQQVTVDEVYLDLEQAAAVLAAGSSGHAGPPFPRLMQIGRRTFCPIADFMARAAKKTAKSSRVFKVILQLLTVWFF